MTHNDQRKEELAELKMLNARWCKAEELEKTGYYDDKSPEFIEKCVKELMAINKRATELHEKYPGSKFLSL